MPPFIVHESEIDEDEGRYPPPFDGEPLTFGRDLGRAAGSGTLGAWVERLPAGRRTSFTHAHQREEELIYVLDGNPVLRWIAPGEVAREAPLRAGHFVSFPAGTGIAHHVHNPGPAEARLLVVGERHTGDRIHYPEDPAFEAWRAEHRPERCWSDLRAVNPDASAPAWRIQTARSFLRPWQPGDTTAFIALVARNRARLAPWMPWVDAPHAPDDVVSRFLSFHRAFATREDFVYGAFRNGQPIGGCGLHRRVGPGALEIGYWVDGAHEGQGLVSEWVVGLTRVAFLVEGVDRVEIHMDPRNLRSAAIPRRLGFTHEATLPRRVQAHDGRTDSMIWSLYRSEIDRLGSSELSAWDVLDRRLV